MICNIAVAENLRNEIKYTWDFLIISKHYVYLHFLNRKFELQLHCAKYDKNVFCNRNLKKNNW